MECRSDRGKVTADRALLGIEPILTDEDRKKPENRRAGARQQSEDN
jgi:hypothetical protein